MLHISRDRREPISMGDVVIFDGKKEYKLVDLVYVGNDKDLIWANDYQRNKIIRTVFRTAPRIKKQRENPKLRILSIYHKVSLGTSNVEWGCTKF